MKKLLQKITASIKISDIFRVCGLMAINLVHMFFSFYPLLVLALFVDDWYPHLMNRYPNFAILIIVTALAIPTGFLIRTLKVWLVSLPVQVIVYFVILSLCLNDLVEAFSGDAPYLLACIICTAFFLLAQIPGVAVGLLIRYLIRKIRARKQATPIA